MSTIVLNGGLLLTTRRTTSTYLLDIFGLDLSDDLTNTIFLCFLCSSQGLKVALKAWVIVANLLYYLLLAFD